MTTVQRPGADDERLADIAAELDAKYRHKPDEYQLDQYSELTLGDVRFALEIARLSAPAGGDLVERASVVRLEWRRRQVYERRPDADGALYLDEIAASFAAAVQREAREAALTECVQRLETYYHDIVENEDWPGQATHQLGVLDSAVEMLRSLSGTAPQSGWRHKKRGSVYSYVGEANVQTEAALRDDDRVVVYRGTDGRLWVRPYSEFHDGRFERLRPSPPTEDAT